MVTSSSNWSQGSIRAYLSPAETSIVSRTLIYRRGAAWRCTPTCSINCRNGSDDPSKAGSSAPSNSISRLSIPAAERAASKCSIVDTLTPAAFVRVVQFRTPVTKSGLTGITLSRSETSNLTKFKPDPTPAGRKANRVCSPLCKAILAVTAADFSVD